MPIDIKIIGIMLIKDEDIFIERAIRNIVEFCDRIIVTDHQSRDHTFEIVQKLADEFDHIELQSIESPRESALAIEPYFGTNTWIFGVDGDEIYDPAGLRVMRKLILEGAFAGNWNIYGNALNCVSLDLIGKRAKGYLAPPSRSTTKLYNFALLEKWVDCPERLHGENIVFRRGYHEESRRRLHEEMAWGESYLRHLHMPFMRRSSLQKIHGTGSRLNPDELMRSDYERNPAKKRLKWAKIRFLHILGFNWKNRKYRRGPLVEKDISAFFPYLKNHHQEQN